MILRISLVVLLLAIAYLSLTPSTSVSVGNDKLGHFLAYGALMTNLGLVMLPGRNQFILGMILALGYGAAMEGGQYFVPGRSVSMYDMLANLGGVVIGAVLAQLIYAKFSGLVKRFR